MNCPRCQRELTEIASASADPEGLSMMNVAVVCTICDLGFSGCLHRLKGQALAEAIDDAVQFGMEPNNV